ncbi:MAG: hypothetical protein IPN63_06925 [Gammaproteobacteria bacterium]|nr:hypothetical protein [Gammaproteobacteria bacterium]
MKARFVICANGILSKPKLTKIQGMETFKGHRFTPRAGITPIPATICPG